jgi:hypothetical protein
MHINAWKEVQDEHWEIWNITFKNSRESLDLNAVCPVCGNRTLHCWYDYIGARPGQSVGYWEWCSSCHSFSHGHSRVPEWWSPPLDFKPDLSEIRVIPDIIEVQRLAWTKLK